MRWTTKFSTSWKPVRLFAGLLLIALIGGCMSVGPDYTKPEVDADTDWLDLEQSLLTNAPPTDPTWWKKAFEDKPLRR